MTLTAWYEKSGEGLPTSLPNYFLMFEHKLAHMLLNPLLPFPIFQRLLRCLEAAMPRLSNLDDLAILLWRRYL